MRGGKREPIYFSPPLFLREVGCCISIPQPPSLFPLGGGRREALVKRERSFYYFHPLWLSPILNSFLRCQERRHGPTLLKISQFPFLAQKVMFEIFLYCTERKFEYFKSNLFLLSQNLARLLFPPCFSFFFFLFFPPRLPLE